VWLSPSSCSNPAGKTEERQRREERGERRENESERMKIRYK
jgi:hypothetical protein